MVFGLKDTSERRTLNDYLSERCRVGETAVEVTPDAINETKGHIWLVPSSLQAGEIAKVLREGYNLWLLNDGLQDLIDELLFDYRVSDTLPCRNEQTLLSVAIS